MSAAEQKGQNGFIYTTGTTAVVAEVEVFWARGATVFASITSPNAQGASLVGFTLADGELFRGRFTGYQLTSGAVIAYLKGPI